MPVFDDMMAAGGVGLLMQVHGQAAAIEIGTDKFDGIVCSPRTEEVPTIQGGLERWVHRDICRVSIRCEPGTVDQKTRLKIIRYTKGDASTHAGQLFHVRQINSVTDQWTTVEAWRDSLAKVQRAGTEGAA